MNVRRPIPLTDAHAWLARQIARVGDAVLEGGPLRCSCGCGAELTAYREGAQVFLPLYARGHQSRGPDTAARNREIVALRAAGASWGELRRRYHLSKPTIMRICGGAGPPESPSTEERTSAVLQGG